MVDKAAENLRRGPQAEGTKPSDAQSVVRGSETSESAEQDSRLLSLFTDVDAWVRSRDIDIDRRELPVYHVKGPEGRNLHLALTLFEDLPIRPNVVQLRIDKWLLEDPNADPMNFNNKARQIGTTYIRYNRSLLDSVDKMKEDEAYVSELGQGEIYPERGNPYGYKRGQDGSLSTLRNVSADVGNEDPMDAVRRTFDLLKSGQRVNPPAAWLTRSA